MTSLRVVFLRVRFKRLSIDKVLYSKSLLQILVLDIQFLQQLPSLVVHLDLEQLLHPQVAQLQMDKLLL